MWKIVAVFLLLLVAVAVFPFDYKGLNWILFVFFSLIGIGLYFFVFASVKKDKHTTGELKDIKNAMGSPDFKELRKEAAPAIELPKLSEPNHPAETPIANELHSPAIETPKMADLPSMPATDGEKEPLVSIDLAKLKAKIKADDDAIKPADAKKVS